MAVGLSVVTYSPGLGPRWPGLGPPRRVLVASCTPVGMDTDTTPATAPTMTLSELADLVSVSTQALYDCGPRAAAPTASESGASCRSSEIEAWIASRPTTHAATHHGAPREHAQLVDAVAELRQSDKWTQMLAVAVRFTTYSPSNVLLTAVQRPDATQVAGSEGGTRSAGT